MFVCWFVLTKQVQIASQSHFSKDKRALTEALALLVCLFVGCFVFGLFQPTIVQVTTWSHLPNDERTLTEGRPL